MRSLSHPPTPGIDAISAADAAIGSIDLGAADAAGLVAASIARAAAAVAIGGIGGGAAGVGSIDLGGGADVCIILRREDGVASISFCTSCSFPTKVCVCKQEYFCPSCHFPIEVYECK